MGRKRGRILGAILIMGWLTSVGWGTASEPQRGGSVRWFITADPRQLDPHMATSPGEQQAVSGLYSGLLQYDTESSGKVIPDLADRWELSSKHKVYTFYLRRDVQWHDGVGFTAADVLATFTRLLAPSARHTPCGSALQPIVKDIEGLDEYTVRFYLKAPAASFLPTLASGWCAMTAKHVLQRHGDQWHLTSQTGTGPFRLQAYVPGSHIEWERNPTYYDSRYPYVDRVTQVILSDHVRQLNDAQAGQVHLWAHWPPLSRWQKNELQQSRDDAIHLYQQPLNTVWAIHLNPNRAPFDRPEIRRAVHLALDRQALFEAAFAGAGAPCAILDPAVYGQWALPLNEVRTFPGCRQPKAADVAEAKALVTSLYPDGLTVDISVRGISNYLERAQMIMAQLRQVGISGRIKAYGSQTGWQRYHEKKFVVIGTEDTTMMMSDPSALFDMLFASQGRHNWSKWKDTTVDRLVRNGKREMEPEKRRRIYHALQLHLLSGDSPSVIVGWVSGWFFHDKRLHNYPPSVAAGRYNGLKHAWLSPSP